MELGDTINVQIKHGLNPILFGATWDRTTNSMDFETWSLIYVSLITTLEISIKNPLNIKFV